MRISTLSLLLGLSISSVYSSDDPLNHQDWDAVFVDQRPDLPEQHNSPVNAIGEPWGDFSLSGSAYKIQNVSGNNMACFFNSMGLNAAQQAKLLRDNKDNPLVRWMVGNDILSATHNPEQLSAKVKQAMGYDEYMQARQKINDLEEERNRILGANGGDTDALPEELKKAKIVEKEHEIFVAFKQRCMSNAAFLAYVDTYIDNNEMMAFAPDGGSNYDDIGQNFTAIDAIGYLNNIGIQIYTWADPDKPLENNNLHLSHQYIPAGAMKVARLYYHLHHFQAFVPVVDAQEELRKQEAERQAKAQEELLRQQEAEIQKHKDYAERQAKAEAEALRKQEAERQAKAEGAPQEGDIKIVGRDKMQYTNGRWVRIGRA